MVSYIALSGKKGANSFYHEVDNPGKLQRRDEDNYQKYYPNKPGTPADSHPRPEPGPDGIA